MVSPAVVVLSKLTTKLTEVTPDGTVTVPEVGTVTLSEAEPVIKSGTTTSSALTADKLIVSVLLPAAPGANVSVSSVVSVTVGLASDVAQLVENCP